MLVFIEPTNLKLAFISKIFLDDVNVKSIQVSL